jgi:hypothetical protein
VLFSTGSNRLRPAMFRIAAIGATAMELPGFAPDA